MTKNKNQPKFGKVLILYTNTIKNSYKEIKDYTVEMNTYFSSKQRNLTKSINESPETRVAKESTSDLFEQYVEYSEKYNETYPELLMHSTFIASFSKFEHLFILLCKVTERGIFSKVKLKDINGKGIQQCRNYLLKVVELDLEDVDKDWQTLLDYQKIRNLIVHNNATYIQNTDIPLEKQAMHNYIVKNKNLRIKYDGTDLFQISDSKFILEFCDCAERFLIKILNKAILTWQK
ncbi:hypothetical protein [Draconibacterium mangrovi]|uniref:hypothetical protein n=1 Tax=Draconibacterium mangrovi TaxID=2697469 RepID=UPI0013D172DC|nr:hypothetical protein [Draconibacterium mangrovi]